MYECHVQFSIINGYTHSSKLDESVSEMVQNETTIATVCMGALSETDVGDQLVQCMSSLFHSHDGK